MDLTKENESAEAAFTRLHAWRERAPVTRRYLVHQDDTGFLVTIWDDTRTIEPNDPCWNRTEGCSTLPAAVEKLWPWMNGEL